MLVLGKREKSMSHGLFSRPQICAVLRNRLSISLIESTCTVLLLLSVPNLASAADLTWNGLYRVEGVQVQNSEMSSANTDKAYVLHHLILSPKLVIADGITVHSRLDILNNSAYGISSSRNPGEVTSVAGDLLGGSGPGTPVNTTAGTGPVSGSDSNSWGQSERAGTIAVTELYLTWAQEFGQFIVGRVPLQFGLITSQLATWSAINWCWVIFP